MNLDLVFQLLVIGLGMGGLLSLYRSVRRTVARATMQCLRETAARLGLPASAVRRDLLIGPVLDGEVGGFGVRITTSRDEKAREHLRVVVQGRGALPQRLYLRAEDSLSRAFRGRDVEIGDPVFDSEVLAWGQPVWLSAMLDAETRREVRRLVRDREGSVEDGDIIVDLPPNVYDDERVAAAVNDSVRLADLLRTPTDVVARLAASSTDDPCAGVRLTCLERLRERFPDDPRTAAALRAAIADPDNEVRLYAAGAFGDEGHATLLQLVEAPETDDYVRAMAITALGKDLPVDLALPLLEDAMARDKRGLAGALVEALGVIGGERAQARLAELAARRPAEIAVLATRAFARIGGPAASDVLCRLLASDSKRVTKTAASELATVGSVAAVAPLRALVACYPLDPMLKRIALASIAAIQARATGAAPGQLALAAAPAVSGAVALVDEDSGALSLVEPESSGQVSLVDGPNQKAASDEHREEHTKDEEVPQKSRRRLRSPT